MVNNTVGNLDEIAFGEKNSSVKIKNNYLWNQIVLAHDKHPSD
jgi:hypothetical protein